LHPTLKYDPGYFLVHRDQHDPEQRRALLRALAYCLHLPRSRFDLLRTPARLVRLTRNFEPAHRIAFLSYPDAFQPENSDALGRLHPALLLSADDLIVETEALARQVGAPLGAISFSELTQNSLTRHWKELTALVPEGGPFPPIDSPAPILQEMSELTPMRLAVMFLGRQFALEAMLDGIEDANDIGLIDLFIEMHRMISAVAEIKETGEPGEFAQQMKHQLTLQPLFPPVPLVLGSLTPSREKFPWDKIGIEPFDALLEEQAYLSMLSHRTLASKGIGLRLNDVPDSLMQRLRQFEELCAQTPVDIKKVWWLLDSLGREAGKFLGRVTEILASHLPAVAIFSDYPFGLALVGDASSPLQFQTAVSYRPVTPIAIALEHELTLVPLVFLRGGFSILLAECLDPSDPLFSPSQFAWTGLQTSLQDLPGLKFEIALVRSVEQLNLKLQESTIDVLIVSGHGGRSADGLSSGVQIGKTIWYGDGIDHGPTIVVLSACETFPRSSETLNIADILLARGTVVVVGTLAPISFGHNADFLHRLFQAVYHGILGNEAYRTLDQAWRATLCATVINDIMRGSRPLEAWALLEWDRMMDQYIEQCASNRIRTSHIYADVERFLREYAAERGVLDLFADALQPRCYFPETLMYLMIGRPERIVLRDEIHETLRLDSTRLDRLGRPKDA
jgi:hypothetical protein